MEAAPSTLLFLTGSFMTNVGGGVDGGKELALRGGYVTAVVRVGDTVRRAPGPRAAFVRALLRHFEAAGWDGAPRYLGTDERGRDVLSYVPGYVAWERQQPPAVCSSESLAAAAALVRRLHDLTAGTPLAGAAEVVCHNDLSPRNTVYRDGGAGLRPVALIDWDLAAPGARIHDVAHLCWQFLDLGPTVADAAAGGQAMRLLCDAYGLADRGALVDTVLWWQDRCWRGIAAGAAAGNAAMRGLQADGIVEEIVASYQWVDANRATLEAALR
jgi:hypothetical protein